MRPTPKGFPAFAGVALADILANSVAIVIIMIVVTLMVRHEEETEKLTQTEDVAVLLSRELASSFVMNALPTSPPAQLHDYVSSPLDRNPHHATMPIIELHARFVRDYYTGKTYGRDELLRHDNAFDTYLRSLTPEQLAAVRMDIYSTRLFYVAMSILKAHGHTPRHWHFLGGGPGTGTHTVGALALDRPRQEPQDAKAGDGLGPAAGASRRRGTRAGAWPQDVALAPVRGGSPYPRDEPAGLGASFAADTTLGLPGSHGLPAPGAPSERRGEEAATPSPVKRFRAATPAARVTAPAKPLQFDLARVVRGLWVFMAAEQQSADEGLPSRLPRYDFERDVLGAADADAPSAAGTPDAEAEAQAVRGIAFLLAAPRRPAENTLALRPKTDAAVRGQALAVFPNEPIGRSLWLGDAHQPARTETVHEEVTLRLGLHAEVHAGVRLRLGRDALLLTPYAQAAPDPAPRWRVVTLVNAARDDFVTGFVYAAVDAAGRLVLPMDENAVEVGGLRVQSRFPAVALRGETRRLWLYGLVAFVFALGLVARYWRAA